jgi:uncharacterized radical SAM protein YgiQ
MKGQPLFLPISREEGTELGIDSFDVIIVSGDACVDHPSFAPALLGRALWEEGFSTAIIPQPDWTGGDDFRRLGRPRLFFAVSSGAVDPMVNHYTSAKKQRSEDVYSPGGRRKRPDRAALVYADRLHALFPGTPVILGGIEASLRRFAHYDYWSDRVRQSILADAPADLLVFGMGELALCEIARRLSGGEDIRDICDIPGTVYKGRGKNGRSPAPDTVILPSFSEVSGNKKAFAQACRMIGEEQDPIRGRPLLQQHPKVAIIQNPPSRPLSTEELDALYELPFTRARHPSYREPVPALEPVKFSLVTHRGCFGNCNFCALSSHQGCIIQSRSRESLVREVGMMACLPGWKGIVQDAGGPTANMFGMVCHRWSSQGNCPDRACIDCPSLDRSLEPWMDMLRTLREIPGVRKVFVSSGIRYDLFGTEDSSILEELCTHHISGHLKVAPEHVTRAVTDRMGKPPGEVFFSFRKRFETLQGPGKKRAYLLPYFMAGHPGCSLQDMVELAEFIRDANLYTEQVQDFTPTPMTRSTSMYYTGLDPETLEPVHVPRDREKKIQRALLHYRDPKNRDVIDEGLRRAGRADLIGWGKKCLIRPKG